MSYINLTHNDLSPDLDKKLNLQSLYARRMQTDSLDQPGKDLTKVAEITGYLVAMAALALVVLTGQFPWFVLMLVASIPLYALMSDRKYAEAEREWHSLRDLGVDSDLARSVMFNLALSVQRQGRDAEAIGHWRQLLDASPDHARARFNLGLALERSGDPAAAAAEYRRVLALDPDHDASRARLARLGQTLPGDP